MRKTVAAQCILLTLPFSTSLSSEEQSNTNVDLPLMHITIELLLKAFAANTDADFRAREFSHDTVRLLKHYAGRIPAFQRLVESEFDLNLICGLSQAWTAVRYGETYIEYDADDWRRFQEIAASLANEFFALKGFVAAPIRSGGHAA
jgi:hypothetical protein